MLLLPVWMTLLTAVHGSKPRNERLRNAMPKPLQARDRALKDQLDGIRRERSFLQQTGIVLDGKVNEWPSLHRVYPKIWERPALDPNFEIYGMHDKASASYYFAIKRNDTGTIAAATTIYLDTDQSTSSSTTHGMTDSEFYIDFVNDAAGVPIPHLYSSNPWAWLGQVQHTFSADRKTVELAVPETLVGGATVGDVDFFVDVNDSKYFPVYFGAPWYTATSYDLPPRTTDPTSKRVAIVFSPESESKLFGGGPVNEYIYGQLYTSVQHQCMMAGIPYDLVYFNALKNLTNIVNYDALIFPYNAFVLQNDLDIVLHNLRLAVHHYGIGVIAADNFLTNLADANITVPLANPYKAMWEVFGLTITGYGSGNMTVTAFAPTHPVMNGYTTGEQVLEYPLTFFNHYGIIAAPGIFETSSTVTSLAKTVMLSNTHNAVLAVKTSTGARHVHFGTCPIMADANLMWQALRWVVFGDASPVGLQISRQKSVFSARNDMDQTRFNFDFEPIDKALLELYLRPWHQKYNFVGTDFVNIGNNPANGEFTDWAIARPVYQAYMAMGDEIASHTYTHPDFITQLSEAELTFEFKGSGLVLQQELGLPLATMGYAQPGNPEDLRTVELLDAMGLYYLSGTYTGRGIGFPSTFGYLSPNSTMAFMAPNMFSDFNLLGWKALTAKQAFAVWTEQYQQLQSHASTPIIHYHWHDYAPFDWGASLFENTIAMAYNGGSEFIVNKEMVARMKKMKDYQLRVSQSAGVVTATVSGGSGTFGTLALDAGCKSTEVIASVDNWYAYNDKKVFLPANGGSFTIRKGASQNSQKTRIKSLPMRAELVNVTGNGTTLTFQFIGNGVVTVELNSAFAKRLQGVGATSTKKSGTTLTMTFNSTAAVKTGSVTLV